MNKTAHIGCSTSKTNTDTFLSNVTFQKRSFRYFLAILPFALVLLISTSYQQNPDDLNYLEQEYFVPGMVDSLRTFLVHSTEPNEVEGEKILDRAYLRSFYFQNGYKPVWIRFNTLSDRASGLLYMIEHAHEYGLEPSNYHIQAIRELQKNLSPEFPRI
jgi:Scaffold domain